MQQRFILALMLLAPACQLEAEPTDAFEAPERTTIHVDSVERIQRPTFVRQPLYVEERGSDMIVLMPGPATPGPGPSMNPRQALQETHAAQVKTLSNLSCQSELVATSSVEYDQIIIEWTDNCHAHNDLVIVVHDEGMMIHPDHGEGELLTHPMPGENWGVLETMAVLDDELAAFTLLFEVDADGNMVLDGQLGMVAYDQ